jgi:hypothetical protein
MSAMCNQFSRRVFIAIPAPRVAHPGARKAPRCKCAIWSSTIGSAVSVPWRWKGRAAGASAQDNLRLFKTASWRRCSRKPLGKEMSYADFWDCMLTAAEASNDVHDV